MPNIMPFFERVACRASRVFASPISVVGVPVACVIWLHLGLGVDPLTLVLSIVAITATQLVLVGQARTDEAIRRKLNELIHAVPDADDDLLRKLDED